MKICRTCNIAKPESTSFRKNSGNRRGTRNECRECEYARKKTYDYRHMAKYYKVKDRYGLSKEQYDELLVNNKNCAICNILFGTTTPHIDHNHKTNKVRGLLCPQCNKGLGQFRDNPAILLNAVKYLLLSD